MHTATVPHTFFHLGNSDDGYVLAAYSRIDAGAPVLVVAVFVYSSIIVWTQRNKKITLLHSVGDRPCFVSHCTLYLVNLYPISGAVPCKSKRLAACGLLNHTGSI